MDATDRQLFTFLARADADISEVKESERTGYLPFEPEYVLEAFRHLLAAGRLRPGMRLLDLGAGTGNIVAVAAYAGLDGTGIELDETHVRRARAKLEGLRFQGLLDGSVETRMAWGNYLPPEYLREHLRGRSVAARYEKQAFPFLPWDGQPAHPYAFLDATPASFDVLFSYVWTQQAPAICELFSRYARQDALLLCAAWKLPDGHGRMLQELGLEATVDPYLDGRRWSIGGNGRRLAVYEIRKAPHP